MQNGGHCKPAVWNSTPETARFELATFDFLGRLVADHGIPCEWKVVGGVHALFSGEEVAAAQRQMERLRQHPDLADKARLVVDADELAALRFPGALAAVHQPVAATCWAYKLVAWLLERLLRDHGGARFNLQTTTPVERLQRVGASWVLHTPRGQVCARDVLLASNAYTSYLLPRMTGLIVPVRGQVCALRPPPAAAPLPHSYGWVAVSDQYLMQQRASQAARRVLVHGGQRLAVPGRQEGIWRDDDVDAVIGARLRTDLAGAVKLLPDDEPDPERLQADYEWTGIMGYSRDSRPWVGRVPGSLVGAGVAGEGEGEGEGDGLWISAGYTGHGMPVAARCGIAVAEMMLGRAGGVEVPRQWLASGARAERARGLELPRAAGDAFVDGLP